jgi:hypothetical protein
MLLNATNRHDRYDRKNRPTRGSHVPEELLTVAAAARRIGVSAKIVQTLVDHGQLATVPVGPACGSRPAPSRRTWKPPNGPPNSSSSRWPPSHPRRGAHAVAGPHSERPVLPLERARLALTVIRNPPSGQVVMDDGTAALRELRSWYPELIREFGEPTLKVAARRASGHLREDVCGFCVATALARVSRQPSPRATRASALLLGRPCSRHERIPTSAARWSTIVASIPPDAPPAVYEKLRAWAFKDDPYMGKPPPIHHSPVDPRLQ